MRELMALRHSFLTLLGVLFDQFDEIVEIPRRCRGIIADIRVLEHRAVLQLAATSVTVVVNG